MKKIRSSKKGFTLAELLIVVAIIGVLVGISIPIFSAQLEKSRESTDIANLRAAKAAAVAAYLDADMSNTKVSWKDANDASKGFTAYYDADEGSLKAAKTGITGYGEGTGTPGNASNTQFDYAPGTAVTDKVIKVEVDGDGVCTFTWEAVTNS